MAKFESYRTKQFYKLNDNVGEDGSTVAGPGGLRQSGINSRNPTNEKFLFPGPYHHRAGDSGEMEKVKVQRGFMRLLLPKDTEGVGNYRFFFQFNPQAIQRDVQMADDVRNPFLQTPAELTQPIYGRTSFNFDMLIDRSFEMNGPYSSATSADRQGTADTMERLSNSPDPLSKMKPDNVGVLSDIRILDTIVGQGISAALTEFMVKQAAIRSDLASQSDTGEDSSTAASFDESAFRSGIADNLGNQAFLLPNPVRVVFSSLFMVDGYVTQMNVKYVRFNEAMVPITATISVSMYALYIGFARPDSILTGAINEAERLDPNAGFFDPTDEDYKIAKSLALRLAKIRVAVGGTYDGGVFGDSDAPRFSYQGDDYPDAYNVIGFNNSSIKIAYEFTTLPVDRYKDSSDFIYTALANQEILGFSINNIKADVWRNEYMKNEPESVDGKIPLLRIETGEVFNATGTGAEDDWFDNTAIKTTSKGSSKKGMKNGQYVDPNTEPKNLVWNEDDDNRNRLLLNDTSWGKWKKEGNSDKTILPYSLIVNASITLANEKVLNYEYRGSGYFRYNDKIVMEANVNLISIMRQEKDPVDTTSVGGGSIRNKVKNNASGGNTGSGPSSAGGGYSGTSADTAAYRSTGSGKMTFDVYSTSWANPPVVGGSPFVWANIDKVVIHHPGAGSGVPDGTIKSEVMQFLNNNHNGYIRDRGYSLGYNAAVDKQGNTYGIRQDKYKCAANVNVNDTSFAILLIVNDDEAATLAQIDATKNLIRQVETYSPNAISITYHKSVGATSCPGDAVIDQVNNGTFNV